MSADALIYFDSSALVKLVVNEAESRALLAYVADRSERASCALARVEVPRAVRPHGVQQLRAGARLVDQLALVPLTDPLLDAAAAIEWDVLRSLDAIHVAAALSLGTELAEVVTYDRRMAEAASAHGLTVVAPR
jgi:predicted nucleic acid-binding protein